MLWLVKTSVCALQGTNSRDSSNSGTPEALGGSGRSSAVTSRELCQVPGVSEACRPVA